MVQRRVPNRPHQTANAGGKRSSALRGGVGKDGAWRLNRSLSGADSERGCSHRTVGASWVIDWKMGSRGLGSTALHGRIRQAVRGRACCCCATPLPRARTDKTHPAIAATEGASWLTPNCPLWVLVA